jgi:hypothetical protein
MADVNIGFALTDKCSAARRKTATKTYLGKKERKKIKITEQILSLYRSKSQDKACYAPSSRNEFPSIQIESHEGGIDGGSYKAQRASLAINDIPANNEKYKRHENK